MTELRPGSNQSRFSEWLNLEIVRDAAGTARGTVTLHLQQEGPPRHVHGGVLASLIDEVMGAAVWATGKRSLAANLNINYRHPAPLDCELRVTGRIDRIEGRKTYTSGEVLLPDGTVAIEGTGLFIEMPVDSLKTKHYDFTHDGDS